MCLAVTESTQKAGGEKVSQSIGLCCHYSGYFGKLILLEAKYLIGMNMAFSEKVSIKNSGDGSICKVLSLHV